MLKKLRQPRLTRWVLALLAFIAIGYVSNALSIPACERRTSWWLNDRLVRHPSNWPGRHAFSEPAEYRLPWIVGVDYEWVVGNLGGEWGTRYYVCLFGLVVPVRNHIQEMT